MNRVYFAFGDNCNAKQLYYFCKKKKLAYPFIRAYSKGLLIDHKLVVTKRNVDSRYGMISAEPSIGHIVPGILFELHPDSDLSIFGNDFEEMSVQTFPSVFDTEVGSDFITAVLNQRETRNVLDIEKAKLSKGRKKVLRQAIKWRNLQNFEACYESAMSNYLYPHMVRYIFIYEWYRETFASKFGFNEYNTMDVLTENGQKGVLYFSSHMSLAKDLKKFDEVLAGLMMNRRRVETVYLDGNKILTWGMGI